MKKTWQIIHVFFIFYIFLSLKKLDSKIPAKKPDAPHNGGS